VKKTLIAVLAVVAVLGFLAARNPPTPADIEDLHRSHIARLVAEEMAHRSDAAEVERALGR
jgi:hypothetical protein